MNSPFLLWKLSLVYSDSIFGLANETVHRVQHWPFTGAMTPPQPSTNAPLDEQESGNQRRRAEDEVRTIEGE